jgi:general secretion pathway protein I
VKGFTLLEVLVALAILAGAVLTVVASFNFHLGVLARDREETAAVLLARARLDDPTADRSPTGTGTFAPERPDLSWEKTLVKTELPGISRMVFTVSWHGGERRVSLVRYQAAN